MELPATDALGQERPERVRELAPGPAGVEEPVPELRDERRLRRHHARAPDRLTGRGGERRSARCGGAGRPSSRSMAARTRRGRLDRPVADRARPSASPAGGRARSGHGLVGRDGDGPTLSGTGPQERPDTRGAPDQRPSATNGGPEPETRVAEPPRSPLLDRPTKSMRNMVRALGKPAVRPSRLEGRELGRAECQPRDCRSRPPRGRRGPRCGGASSEAWSCGVNGTGTRTLPAPGQPGRLAGGVAVDRPPTGSGVPVRSPPVEAGLLTTLM
jgi:hypothetical protein